MIEAASTIIINKKMSILLMLRDSKAGISDPGRWGFIGGQREKGERLKTTAVREIKEETGLSVDERSIKPFVTIQTREKKWHVFVTYGNWSAKDLIRGEGQQIRFVPLRRAFQLRLGDKQRYVLSVLREHLDHHKLSQLFDRSLQIPNKEARK